MTREIGTVVIMSRYGSMGASSRVRLFQYIPYLRARGIQVVSQSLLSDKYLMRKYQGSKTLRTHILSAYIQRMKFLFAQPEHCVMWLEKELLPYVPFVGEKYFLERQKLVIDIDDAIFHRYDQHKNPIVRAAFARKIDLILGLATLVTAGSRYLQQRAIRATNGRVELLPTVVMLSEYQGPRTEPKDEFSVGWIGSPATQKMLFPIVDVLSSVLTKEHDRFITIGSAFPTRLFPAHEQWMWRRESEVQQLAQLQVGIMPLPDEPFERGKCGYKLIQYMATGIPVIASPVGANRDIVKHGENGFLAETPEEWRKAVLMLKENGELRRKMGECGRKMVRDQYALEVTGPKVAQWFAEVATGVFRR